MIYEVIHVAFVSTLYKEKVTTKISLHSYCLKLATSQQLKAMDKTSKDGEGTTERTGFTDQDRNFNSEDGSCHSSLTDFATALEGDSNTQTTAYSTRRGQTESPSSPRDTRQLFAGSSQNLLVDNASVSSAYNSSNFTDLLQNFIRQISGATLNQGSPSSSTTRDGIYNHQDLLNEQIVRLATLQSTFNENLGYLNSDMDRRIVRLDERVFTITEDLRRYHNTTDNRIRHLYDVIDATVERLNILERYFKFMLGGLVFMFVVLLVAFVLVIVLNTK